ncbi:MAG TPA: ATP-binding protein [Stellaceae bacterium]|nr:ATP-binding protein [Stellaceae bacterium]
MGTQTLAETGKPKAGANPDEPSRVRVLSMAGAAAFAVALVLLSVFALNLNLSRLKDSFRWVEHTDEVLLQIASLEATVIDAQAAERGYLLTGEAEYFDTYRRARDAVGDQAAEMADLIADNPALTRSFAELRRLIESRFAQFDEAMGYGPERISEALEVLKTARDQQKTPEIRAGLEKLRNEELQLLALRQQRAEHDAGLANLLAIAAGVLALASLGWAIFFVQRQRERHRIRRLQDELIHVSRLNTMGQTASMLAHEVKQPLTATASYVGGARRLVAASNMEAAPRIADALDKAGKQIERANQIVGRLRDFVHKSDRPRAAENVGAVIDEALSLLDLAGDGVTVRRRIAPDLPAVIVDKVQIQQVLINLVRNAAEAMQQSARREIWVSAEARGDAIEIAVADNGPGLPKEVADKLFQPFVSTKPQGMGIGLSICRTIVENHGGRIAADDRSEGGTVFLFTVPMSAADQPRTRADAST